MKSNLNCVGIKYAEWKLLVKKIHSTKVGELFMEQMKMIGFSPENVFTANRPSYYRISLSTLGNRNSECAHN